MNWIKSLLERAIIGDRLIQNTEKFDALEAVWFQNMQKLEVEDGDVVVLSHPGTMPPGKKEIFREYVNEFLDFAGAEAKVMFLEEGMEMAVLTKPSNNSDLLEEKENLEGKTKVFLKWFLHVAAVVFRHDMRFGIVGYRVLYNRNIGMTEPELKQEIDAKVGKAVSDAWRKKISEGK